MVKLQFDIITIFPHILDSYINESILGRAQKNGLAVVKTHDLREWTHDAHRTVDDTPYGGGVGMVMMIEPIYKALRVIVDPKKKTRTILLSPRGTRFTQKKASSLTQYEQIVFVCGRYEGVDHRVTELVDEEISIGDFVLNGGELPALMVAETVSRLIPGVLGKSQVLKKERVTKEKGFIEFPQYTRPEAFKNWKVPKVLLSGDHKKIEEWRKKQSKVIEK